jgi:hypothetical protein
MRAGVMPEIQYKKTVNEDNITNKGYVLGQVILVAG